MEMHGIGESLYVAVRSLATGTGTLQKRLANAGLILQPLDPKYFHDNKMRLKFNTVMATLTANRVEPPESWFEASAKRLSDEQAQEIASHIVDLCFWAKRMRPLS